MLAKEDLGKADAAKGGGIHAAQRTRSFTSPWHLVTRLPIWAVATVLVAGAAILLAFRGLAVPLGGFHGPGATQKQAPPCDPAWFTAVLPADATLEKVAVVPDGGSYGEGEANIPYRTNPINLPALCAVTVRVRSSASSSFRFGLFLPDAWNSRFLVVGNGGFAGGINWLDMAAGPRYGMASLSTDTGHNSSSTNTAWARNQPEKKADWGWRAMHGSTVLGKQLVRAYYARDKPLTYSYYSGCSTGGRQGLKEMQGFPDSFDGALIGAPAWWTSHLNNYITWVGFLNLPTTDPKHLAKADIDLLAQEVARQCDGVDGVLDGIISTPELCNPDLDRLLCPPADDDDAPSPGRPAANGCLTAPQIATARSIYAAWVSSTPTAAGTAGHARARLLYPGLTPGSEPDWYLVLNGTAPSPYGTGYQRDFLYDGTSGGAAAQPQWDWRAFDESAVALADATDPGNATADDYAALARVRARGGKVLMYHGLADGLVPARGTQLYYNRTVAALAGQAGGGRRVAGGAADAAADKGGAGAGQEEGIGDFLRLFLVPGLQHCWGTAADAPWSIAGAFQAWKMGPGVWSVPGFEDAEHDGLLALVAWVETGRPVDRLVATTWMRAMDPASGVRRQRPVCAWPRTAAWDGVGDVDAAASWACAD